MDFPETLAILGTRNRLKTKNKNTTQKTNKMGNTYLTKTPGGTHVFVKGNQLPSSSTHLIKTSGGFSNYLVDAWFKVYHCFLIVPSEALLYYVTFTTVTDYPSRTRGFLLVFW
jgi:hypothetical protein